MGAKSGLLALLQEQCGGVLSPLSNRAIARTAAWPRQNLEDDSDDIYPIPGYSEDSRAGAGILEAHRLKAFCGGKPNGDYTTGRGRGDISQGEPAPPWMEDEELDTTGVITHEEWETVQGTLKLNFNNDVSVVPLANFGKEEAGSRIRMTLSFYTCPQSEPSALVDDVEPSRDIDLLLCGYDPDQDKNECFAVSESFDDTNEGFDYRLQALYEDVVAYAIFENNVEQPCEEFGGKDPFAWAWVKWGT